MSAIANTPRLSPVETLLAADRAKDLLRFTTAGSVDDGKSTLIGRLLFDSRNVFEDQIQAAAKASAHRGDGKLDLSLLTDGLRAEREQKITIDVAYRYFATARRKFIIADTPGHDQYTRNMATGASTADLAIILIDARHGILEQSRRHACIAHLLGIPRLVVAVNKMDLAGYGEGVFRAIEAGFKDVLSQIGSTEPAWFIPISALTGDNVVHTSAAMPWYQGPSLLEYLETVDVPSPANAAPFRFPVQYVIRPNQDFRGYAGQIVSGMVQPGDPILALPGGRRSRVKSISTFDGDLQVAHAPMSITLTLEDEVDISRGDMLAHPTQVPTSAARFEADVVWMSEQPLDPGRPLLLKHTTQTVKAEIEAVVHRLDILTLRPEPARTLALNGIGVLRIRAAKPLFFDPYHTNRETGSFILIDPATNATIAGGMIRQALAAGKQSHPVTSEDRARRFGHRGAIVPAGTHASQLERLLFDRGCAVVVAEASAAPVLAAAGLLVVTAAEPKTQSNTAEAILRELERTGILFDSLFRAEGEGI